MAAKLLIRDSDLRQIVCACWLCKTTEGGMMLMHIKSKYKITDRQEDLCRGLYRHMVRKEGIAFRKIIT